MSPARIQLALISHTNSGKTALARTLLGADVGEMRDGAHVTQEVEPHVLLETTAGDSLTLWDTPGFGDSARLARRLAMAGNPIGWFLREVIDRYRDRAFWLSQKAVRVAREGADVVLYLVNSAERPDDAGYLPYEMQILEWIGKPVLVVLNQLGPPRPHSEEAEGQREWTSHLARYPQVRATLPLDAFGRSWVHEQVFYATLGEVLPQPLQDAHARLLNQWRQEHSARLDAAMQVLAAQLAAVARDMEPVEVAESSFVKSALQLVGIGRKEGNRLHERAVAQLFARTMRGTDAATRELLILHRLEPRDAVLVNAQLNADFKVRAPVDKAQAGLLGAILAGAGAGLVTDIATGGLTFGGGALLGGLVGAFGAAGAAWGINVATDRGHPELRYSDDFLQSLLVMSVLRYLTIAHFGRARGQFIEGQAPAFWQVEVERAVQSELASAPDLWSRVRADAKAAPELASRLAAICVQVLGRLYPAHDLAWVQL